MTEQAVVIAGAGPTGLMLAGELALAGCDVVVVERRRSQDLEGLRAGGLHARTIEVLDQRGIAERFLAEGTLHSAIGGFSLAPVDVSDFPSRYPGVLALWQSHFERILGGWIDELGVPILRGREVVALSDDGGGVDVALSDGETLRARYLVGCDGGRSTVRKGAGIEFVGLDPSTSWLIAQVEMDGEPAFGFRRDAIGTHAIGRRGDGEPFGVVLTERQVERGEPSPEAFRRALVDVYGSDFGLSTIVWLSRFTDMSRQATAYREGRVLLAGDAAHVHPPQGGQGLNTGVQDAVNLGWKLARVVLGTSPESLLDSYHAERHPVGARVLHNTMAQVALAGPGERHQALREIMTSVMGMDEPRRRIAGMLSGLDIHYDLGEGHPLLGRRMPDLDLETADGPTRVFALLHEGRGVLIRFGEGSSSEAARWAGRVRVVEGSYSGAWELPVVGAVEAPPAVLVRPDGYVAWVGEVTEPGLAEAVALWFGAGSMATASGSPGL